MAASGSGSKGGRRRTGAGSSVRKTDASTGMSGLGGGSGLGDGRRAVEQATTASAAASSAEAGAAVAAAASRPQHMLS